MAHLGEHYLVDLYNCAINLDDPKEIESILVFAATKALATILHTYSYKFSPQGISSVVVIKESHLTAHTWPEEKFAAVDIFTCGSKVIPRKAAEYIVDKFRPKRYEISEQERGEI